MRPTVSPTPRSSFWRAGLSAALYLGLGVPVVFGALFALSDAIPLGHRAAAWATALTPVLALLGLCGAGALWGRALARQTGLPARRLAWTSGPLFGALTLAVILLLGRIEVLFVEVRVVRDAPIHVVFAIAFTLAAFAVTAGLALGVGWAARGWRFGLALAMWAGLAAAIAFLAADIVQDVVGRRVGAPGAERTATMLTVAFIGNLVAAFVGGGVMGVKLTGLRPKAAAAPSVPALEQPSEAAPV